MPILPLCRSNGDYGRPANGLYLPWLDVPVVKITNCLLAPSAMSLANHRKNKAASGVAPVLTLPCGSFAATVVLVQQRSATRKATTHNIADCIECGACAWVSRAIFPWCNISVRKKLKLRLSSGRKARRRSQSAFRSAPGSLEREKAARLERHKSAAVQPEPKIKMRLLPLWRG